MGTFPTAPGRAHSVLTEVVFCLAWLFLLATSALGALAVHEMELEQLHRAACETARAQPIAYAPKYCVAGARS